MKNFTIKTVILSSLALMFLGLLVCLTIQVPDVWKVFIQMCQESSLYSFFDILVQSLKVLLIGIFIPILDVTILVLVILVSLFWILFKDVVKELGNFFIEDIVDIDEIEC